MKYSIVFLLFLMLIMAGCHVLEKEPVSEIALDQQFKTEVDLRGALMGAYYRMGLETPGASNEMPLRYLLNGEVRSDSYTSRNATTREDIKGNINNVYPYTNWQAYYSSIRAINNIIFYGPDIPAERFTVPLEKNRLMGEAYFLRGFAYFNMLRVWENLVLSTEPHLNAESNFTKPQVAPVEIIKLIESDLLRAALLMPVNFPTNHRGRATKGAAHALLAKFYVYISSPYAQSKLNPGPVRWAEAAKYADSVIRNTQFRLVPTAEYATIFTQNSTTESIFEIVYNALIPGSNNVNDFVMAFLPRKNTPPTGGNFTFQPSDKIIKAYKAMNDVVRFNAAMGEVRATEGWLSSDIGRNSIPGQTEPNHYVKKYMGSLQGTIRFSDSDIIGLRLADVILLRAEALLAMGDAANAQLELNKITDRAGITRRTVSVREILQQRWLELAFEGDRWYDLKRHQLLEAEAGAPPYPKGYLFPIINGEIINNPNVKQNPGWE